MKTLQEFLDDLSPAEEKAMQKAEDDVAKAARSRIEELFDHVDDLEQQIKATEQDIAEIHKAYMDEDVSKLEKLRIIPRKLADFLANWGGWASEKEIDVGRNIPRLSRRR